MKSSGPPDEIEAGTLSGLLAEPQRLRVFAAVALGASTAEAAAQSAGVETKEAIVALERLAAAGAVVQRDGGLEIAVEVFKGAARRAATERRREADMMDALAGVPAEKASVLRHFVDRGRLTSIPVQKSKRLIVLDWLANRFEPGVTYPEKQVNFELRKVHPDVAALRRYLVDEGLLERRDAMYWRAGGTYDV